MDMCTGSGCIAISLAVLGGYQNVTGGGYFRGGAARGKEKCETSFFDSEGNCAVRIVSGIGGSWCIRLKTWLAKGPRLQAEIEEHSLTLLQSNLFQAVEADVMYDVIVSNPPYIPSAVIDGLEPEVRDHEPRLALDGSEDGLYFYRVLALECSKHLNKGGCVYFEIGYDQAGAVSRILTIAGYREIEVIKDEPGLNRVVKARWNR